MVSSFIHWWFLYLCIQFYKKKSTYNSAFTWNINILFFGSILRHFLAFAYFNVRSATHPLYVRLINYWLSRFASKGWLFCRLSLSPSLCLSSSLWIFLWNNSISELNLYDFSYASATLYLNLVQIKFTSKSIIK